MLEKIAIGGGGGGIARLIAKVELFKGVVDFQSIQKTTVNLKMQSFLEVGRGGGGGEPCEIVSNFIRSSPYHPRHHCTRAFPLPLPPTPAHIRQQAAYPITLTPT